MPEWLNGTVSKTVVRATVPRVRIPLSPQVSFKTHQIPANRYLCRDFYLAVFKIHLNYALLLTVGEPITAAILNNKVSGKTEKGRGLIKKFSNTATAKSKSC